MRIISKMTTHDICGRIVWIRKVLSENLGSIDSWDYIRITSHLDHILEVLNYKEEKT